MAKNKFYVVWAGVNPGIYDNWEDCRLQVENFPGARYKAFSSAAAAAEAYRSASADDSYASLGSWLGTVAQKSGAKKQAPDYRHIAGIDLNGWAVDAACSGNPGVMEYRCVDLATGNEVFHFGPVPYATNNIGEFLALVHALALMHQRGEWHTIYTDSATALSWLRNRQCKTKLPRNENTEKVFQLLTRAVNWISTHGWMCRIEKWKTESWGEIPADFGRK